MVQNVLAYLLIEYFGSLVSLVRSSAITNFLRTLIGMIYVAIFIFSAWLFKPSANHPALLHHQVVEMATFVKVNDLLAHALHR